MVRQEGGGSEYGRSSSNSSEIDPILDAHCVRKGTQKRQTKLRWLTLPLSICIEGKSNARQIKASLENSQKKRQEVIEFPCLFKGWLFQGRRCLITE